MRCPLCCGGGYETKLELREHIALSHASVAAPTPPPPSDELTTAQLRLVFNTLVTRHGHQMVEVSNGLTVDTPTHLCGVCGKDTDGLWAVEYVHGGVGKESLCARCAFMLPTTRRSVFGMLTVKTTWQLIHVERVGGTLGNGGPAKWRMN